MKKIIPILLAILLVVGGIFLVSNIQSKESFFAEPTTVELSGGITVTVAVRCDTVKQHASENPAIPSDGVIVEECTETLAPGSTAYDLLLLTAKKNGFTFINQAGADADYKDAYISSVQGINAGDYGDYSGWLFYVNGEMASVGCGAYELKAGDKVEWLYSCNFGEDLK